MTNRSGRRRQHRRHKARSRLKRRMLGISPSGRWTTWPLIPAKHAHLPENQPMSAEEVRDWTQGF